MEILVRSLLFMLYKSSTSCERKRKWIEVEVAVIEVQPRVRDFKE